MKTQNDDFVVIIPARFASIRLPGKLLLQIGDKTLIQHVCDRASESDAKQIIVATDDQRIFDHVSTLGVDAIMTSDDCQSGTDRIAEASEKLYLTDETVIVNLQGDEPFMPATVINQIAASLNQNPLAAMSTGCELLANSSDFSNPDIVKVVCDKNGFALYFSRSMVPYSRESIKTQKVYKHLGIYAYTVGYIKQFASLNPCELEQTEKLEQLRVLWHGDKIIVTEIKQPTGVGVDTKADLEQARKLFAELNND